MDEIMVYIVQWMTLALVFTLAAMSPGPDFVVSVRNSLIYSRRAGLITALGFGLGVAVHATYTVFGIAALISQSILVFSLIKYAGAFYLVYLGIQALHSRGAGEVAVDRVLASTAAVGSLSDWAALRSGFLTNVLNPKTTLFFLAIFSQIIRIDTPVMWQFIYGATCSVIIVSWFGLVAFVLTQKRVRNAFLRYAKWLDRVCGVMMIGLAAKVALSSK